MRSSIPRAKLTVQELVIFASYGSLLFFTRFSMQFIPSVHLLALFIVTISMTYRMKALIPLYVYVSLELMLSGFAMWWMPYLYIWLPLWALGMCLSGVKNKTLLTVLSMLGCALHGLSFGLLYAPAQALMFGLSFKATVAWWVGGLYFDLIHGISNGASAILVVPMYRMMKRLRDQSSMF